MIDPYSLPDDLPRPVDDGAAAHLEGTRMPPVELAATDGSAVRLDELAGLTIVYAYPWTGRPGGRIERVWYPVFPPDAHAAEVLAALRAG